MKFTNFKTKIKKIFASKTHKKQLKNTPLYWAYKLTVDDVSIIFESGDLSRFGFRKKKKFNQFLAEYNQLFNAGVNNDELEIQRFILGLYIKSLKYRAMYNSLLTCEGKNSKEEFKKIYGKDFDVKDIERLIKKYENLIERIKIVLNSKKDTKENKLTFSELIAIVESSRGMPIDRNMKLYQFKKIYDIELKRNGRHK